MNETNSNDEALFDRLVDGEIPSEERRRLLASLDDRPGGWRQCALAFLEAQSWRTDLGPLVREANVAPPQTQSTSAATATDRFARRRAVGWLAIAASLLFAFRLGSIWQGNSSGSRGGDAGVDNGHQIAGAPIHPAPVSPAVRRPNDDLTFWVHDAAGGAQQVNVPLVDASTLDRQFGVKFRHGLPDAVREHLERNGYDVQSTRRYAPLWLDSGRSLVVPVEDTRIVPVSPVVY